MDEDWIWDRTGAVARPRNAEEGTGAPTGRGAAPTAAWMVTFSDLTLLLLTFFVLLFSMSSLRTEAWQSLIDGLSTRPDVLVERPTTETSPESVAEAVTPPPADDLRYLEGLISDARRVNPALTDLLVVRGGDRLVLALPSDSFARQPDGGEVTPTAQGQELLGALAGLLARLDNRLAASVAKVEEEGLRPGARRSTWETALADAEAVARALRRSGYPHPIDVFAHVGPSAAVAGSAAPHVPRSRPVALVLLPEGVE